MRGPEDIRRDIVDKLLELRKLFAELDGACGEEDVAGKLMRFDLRAEVAKLYHDVECVLVESAGQTWGDYEDSPHDFTTEALPFADTDLLGGDRVRVAYATHGEEVATSTVAPARLVPQPRGTLRWLRRQVTELAGLCLRSLAQYHHP